MCLPKQIGGNNLARRGVGARPSRIIPRILFWSIYEAIHQSGSVHRYRWFRPVSRGKCATRPRQARVGTVCFDAIGRIPIAHQSCRFSQLVSLHHRPPMGLFWAGKWRLACKVGCHASSNRASISILLTCCLQVPCLMRHATATGAGKSEQIRSSRCLCAADACARCRLCQTLE